MCVHSKSKIYTVKIGWSANQFKLNVDSSPFSFQLYSSILCISALVEGNRTQFFLLRSHAVKSQAVSFHVSVCSKFCASFTLCALIFVSVFFAEKNNTKQNKTKQTRRFASVPNQLIVSVDVKHHVYLLTFSIRVQCFFIIAEWLHEVLTMTPILI